MQLRIIIPVILQGSIFKELVHVRVKEILIYFELKLTLQYDIHIAVSRREHKF